MIDVGIWATNHQRSCGSVNTDTTSESFYNYLKNETSAVVSKLYHNNYLRTCTAVGIGGAIAGAKGGVGTAVLGAGGGCIGGVLAYWWTSNN